MRASVRRLRWCVARLTRLLRVLVTRLSCTKSIGQRSLAGAGAAGTTRDWDLQKSPPLRAGGPSPSCAVRARRYCGRHTKCRRSRLLPTPAVFQEERRMLMVLSARGRGQRSPSALEKGRAAAAGDEANEAARVDAKPEGGDDDQGVQEHVARRNQATHEVMTQVLHQAVIPFLRAHGPQRNVRMNAARIVALRPEEAAVSVLERWLDPKTFRRFFRAFLRLLAVNRKLPAPAAWLAGFVSVDRVRTAAEQQDRLWERTGYAAIYALQEKPRLPPAAPRPDVLVFGPTH